MTKIIIAAGGRGTRIHDLTSSIIPKSLCRISEKTPRSLISYQLQQLAEAGFTEIFIKFEFDWQIQLFNQLVRIKEVPALNYKTVCMSWEHVLSAFNNEELLDFIGTDNFILTYGDLFYSKDLLYGMQALSDKNKTSVASLMYSHSDRWKDGEQKITFSKDENSRVLDVGLTKEGSFTMHAPFFFQNRALESIKEELSSDPPRTIPLLKILVKKKQLSVFNPDFLLNMNKPEDILTMEKGILKYMS